MLGGGEMRGGTWLDRHDWETWVGRGVIVILSGLLGAMLCASI